MKKILVLLISILIVVLSFTGCSKDKEENEDNQDIISADEINNEDKEQEDDSKEANDNLDEYKDFAVYFTHKDMPYLFAEIFEIKSDDPEFDGKLIEEIALDKLINSERGNFISPIPENTRVLELEKDDETIYLNLSKEFIENMPKEKEATELAIDAIVNTLTFFPENEKVIFEIEGEIIEDINGVRLDGEFMFSSKFIPDK